MVIWLEDMKKKHIIVCGENLQTGRSGKEDTEAETLREFSRRRFLSSLCIGRDASNLTMTQWDFQSSETQIIPIHMLCC